MKLENVDRISKVVLTGSIALAATFLAVRAADAQPLQPAPASAPAEQQPHNGLFAYLDVNGDGFVTRAEADRIKGFNKVFLEADDNRDGRLSRDEFIKAQSIYDRVRARTMFDDSLITAKVKAALVKETDLKSLALHVETFDGQVILTGRVNSPAQAQRIERVVASITGVAAVKSALITRDAS